MALYVTTNISALNARRHMHNNIQRLNVSYQRLASGLRINSAKDDAAGLQISNRLTSQINGLNQANRNTSDAIALAQTVEGALFESTNMLQRIRTLAIQASNGTNTNEDRKALQEEVDQLCQEISRIARKTTFAGAQILDGAKGNNDNSLINSLGLLIFQVGANEGDTITLGLSRGFVLSHMLDNAPALNNDGTYVDHNNQSINFARFKVSTFSEAQNTLANIDAYIQYVDSSRAKLGAIQNRMEAIIRNQATAIENLSDARSRIRDTDFAAETAILTANNILLQASQSILAQANQRPSIALNFF